MWAAGGERGRIDCFFDFERHHPESAQTQEYFSSQAAFSVPDWPQRPLLHGLSRP